MSRFKSALKNFWPVWSPVELLKRGWKITCITGNTKVWLDLQGIRSVSIFKSEKCHPQCAVWTIGDVVQKCGKNVCHQDLKVWIQSLDVWIEGCLSYPWCWVAWSFNCCQLFARGDLFLPREAFLQNLIHPDSNGPALPAPGLDLFLCREDFYLPELGLWELLCSLKQPQFNPSAWSKNTLNPEV